MPASPLAPHPHEGAAALLWKGWQPSPGISGSFRVESVAGLLWNQWQLWRGIRTKHVHALLKDDFGLDVHARTVQRHLKRMGFCWLRTKNRPRSLREKAAVRQQRHDYLYEIRRNRQRPPAERYQVVYLDERFLHHHHGGQSSWFSENDFVERMSGKGRRWCFIHAMQENALIEGAFLAFEAKKGTGDYHGQFDWEVFQHWFNEQLLLNLPPRSLIILAR